MEASRDVNALTMRSVSTMLLKRVRIVSEQTRYEISLPSVSSPPSPDCFEGGLTADLVLPFTFVVVEPLSGLFSPPFSYCFDGVLTAEFFLPLPPMAVEASFGDVIGKYCKIDYSRENEAQS